MEKKLSVKLKQSTWDELVNILWKHYDHEDSDETVAVGAILTELYMQGFYPTAVFENMQKK